MRLWRPRGTPEWSQDLTAYAVKLSPDNSRSPLDDPTSASPRISVRSVADLRERVSLRAMLYWLGAAGLIVLILITLGVGSRTRQVSNEANRVVTVYEPAAEDVATVSLAISEMERGLTQYVLGGTEADLRPYVDGERRSALALESLDRLLGTDPKVDPLLVSAEASRTEWLDTVATPTITAVRADEIRRAKKLVLGDLNAALYDQLITDTDKLRYTINAERSAGFAQLSELSTQLSRIVALALLFLVIGLVIAGFLLFRWVLKPLNEVRRQIREVARRGNHERPIEPRGPLEIAAVSKDTEAMRRQLVSEIDEARSAREALEHRAPLVAAIRRELSMPTDPNIRGVRVHGEVRAAEGVLAGDWWDCVAMPSGEAALIITDIAGHGPEAGVAAMRIKHLMALLLASGAGPEEALGLAARTFADEVGRFATVAVVCVDPVSGNVRWSNGGHHPPIILKPDDGIEELERTGPLLSWLGGPWQSRETTMDAEDVLLAFSDGLIESHDKNGAQLELEGLLAIYRQSNDGVGEEEAVRRTLARARERAVDWERDDVTLVALSLKDLDGPLPEPAASTVSLPVTEPAAPKFV